ncbi:MAG: sigma 54-interacting transcriptional regulator [Desulfobacteraceae bacterium]|nr:sigma 54-interacting transcriptional regulator [Desulfobacteraceae bacterium]MBC2757323.1 sigma 54-interacting transcriptional regulator [Desulfobacteraceae bacterium]
MPDTKTRLHIRLKELQKEVDQNKQSFEALQQEQLFSEKVLDSLPGIFYLYDENGNLIRWNKNHETLTGFTAEELPKRKMLDWFSKKDKEKIASEVKELFETGNRREVEAGLIVKNGREIPYYFTGVRMVVEDKVYLIGMGVDLTEIKKIEDALRKSEEEYRTIYENAVEGIFQTTPGGQVVSANPAMARLLGYDSPEELIEEIKDLKNQLYVSFEDRDDFINEVISKKTVSGFEVQFYRKDGTTMWASIHARPVFDEKGKLKLIEGLLADITEQKRATEELRQREAYLRKENIRLRHNIKDRYRFGNIIGKSAAMQEVYELILKAAATDANVIIYGESGTGKELVAGAIHEMSDRSNQRFVPVHCGAIAENLLESEFFGYTKGAFTGADKDKSGYLDHADRGTLFLDELGEISLTVQVKLLRMLEGKGFIPVGGNETKHTDIRIVAATNRNLMKDVEKGLIREDFFYRIHIIPIHLPPLRERREDIPLLIEHFIRTHGQEKAIPPLTGKMLDALLNHRWPGNVRELQNVLYQYIALNKFDLVASAGQTDSDHLETNSPVGGISSSQSFQLAMANFEKKLITTALDKNRWHREKTAEGLGLPSRTFYRKLKKFGLIRPK